MPRKFLSKKERQSSYMKSGQKFTKKKILVPTLTLVMMMFAMGVGPATPQEVLAATTNTYIEMTVDMPEVSISKHETNLVKSSNTQATYSDNWKIDEAGNWKYYLNDGSIVTNSWVQDHGEWYLLGTDGNMRTGVFKSNGSKYYLLDTVRGTGTYGKLLKNGSVYEGITIKADTSADYEGALSEETIASLKATGIDFGNVPNVENTQHVTNGQTTTGNNNSNTGNGGYSGIFNPEDYAGQDGGGATGYMGDHWY